MQCLNNEFWDLKTFDELSRWLKALPMPDYVGLCRLLKCNADKLVDILCGQLSIKN